MFEGVEVFGDALPGSGVAVQVFDEVLEGDAVQPGEDGPPGDARGRQAAYRRGAQAGVGVHQDVEQPQYVGGGLGEYVEELGVIGDERG